MPVLVYSTGSGSSPGWDYFDDMVLWAVTQHRHPTLTLIMRSLPAGISEHLVGKALDLAVAAGLLLRVVDGIVSYQLTSAGRACTVSATHAMAAA